LAQAMAMVQELNLSDQSHDLPPQSTGAAWGEVIRDYVPNSDVKWRSGKPNYTKVNEAYFRNRSKVHEEGSLESVVSKLVKNWEVDSQHVKEIKDWKTMDINKFKASVNGGPSADAQAMADLGRYNVLVGDVDGYKGSANTFESANEIFSHTFTEGFAWEVIEVYSPPPKVTFKWRHFGKFSGKFVDSEGVTHSGNGKLIEVFGLCLATVNKDLLIEELEVFYQPDTQIQPLMTSGGMCPFTCTRSSAVPDEEEPSCIDLA